MALVRRGAAGPVHARAGRAPARSRARRGWPIDTPSRRCAGPSPACAPRHPRQRLRRCRPGRGPLGRRARRRPRRAVHRTVREGLRGGPEAADAVVRAACIVAAETAHELGLGVNAGHDLDHRNLVLFRELPHLDEVSIGHALISRRAVRSGWRDGAGVSGRAASSWVRGSLSLESGGARRGGRPRSAFSPGAIIGAQHGSLGAGPVPARGAGGRARPGRGAAPGGGPARPGHGGARQARNQAQVDVLRKRAADNPRDAAVRAEIGNALLRRRALPRSDQLVRGGARPRPEERRRQSPTSASATTTPTRPIARWRSSSTRCRSTRSTPRRC